jgi:ferredoxin
VIDYRRFELHRADGSVRARVPAGEGETLLDAATRAGQSIRTSCRGSLICGQCVVVVEEGLESLPAPSADEAEMLESSAPGEPRARLACQLKHPAGLTKIAVSTGYW